MTSIPQDPPDTARWLKPKAYAARYQCHKVTACRWAREGRIRCVKTGDRILYIEDAPPMNPREVAK